MRCRIFKKKKTKLGRERGLHQQLCRSGQDAGLCTTSKHAIIGLTKSLALDYGAMGLRCNCICPGITDTPMQREHLNATPDPGANLAAR